MTEISSYWKDLRRILFTDATYTAYVRVERSELRNSWNPVKLTNVLRPFGVDIEELLRGLPTDFRRIEVKTLPEAQRIALVANALCEFGRRLANETCSQVDHARIEEVAAHQALKLVNPENIDDRRDAFNAIVNIVEQGADRNLVQGLRDNAYTDLRSRLDAGSRTQDSANSRTPAQVRMLEVEFVAIYW